MLEKLYYKKIFMHFRRILLKYDYFIDFIFKYNVIYKNYLKLLGYNFSPNLSHKIPWNNTTLKKREDLRLCNHIIQKSKLNFHPQLVLAKNWDNLIALNIILQNSTKSSLILDAGGERDSLILHWLYQFGYKNLKAINLVFNKKKTYGKIEFIPGDLTKTPFQNEFFDIVICLSVIEHGVDDDKYFKEMNRILKIGGILITSTDYWEKEISTKSSLAFNSPIFVYNRRTIENSLKKAYNRGFIVFGPEIDLECEERITEWNKINEKFTFLIFCLQKIKKKN